MFELRMEYSRSGAVDSACQIMFSPCFARQKEEKEDAAAEEQIQDVCLCKRGGFGGYAMDLVGSSQ